jgi:hypothetical protein
LVTFSLEAKIKLDCDIHLVPTYAPPDTALKGSFAADFAKQSISRADQVVLGVLGVVPFLPPPATLQSMRSANTCDSIKHMVIGQAEQNGCACLLGPLCLLYLPMFRFCF